jgi:glycosyltransferase involved in cell wall biosynthesis
MLAVHRIAGTWARCVDRYLALTEWSRRLFVSAGLPPEKIQVKPNFVFPDPRESVAPQARQKKALFVGRLAVEKGIHTLLRAWREIGDSVPLDIVGDGPLALEVDRASREIPGVRWLGALPRQQVYEAMAAATVLVVPSDWYEPFGLSVVEAYAMGLPVIASKSAGLEEIVHDGQTGLHFEPGDSGQLSAKVMWMATHEEERRAMAREARAEFERRYTADSNYGQLMEAYRLAIGGRSQSRINDTKTAPIPGIRYFPA